MPGIATPRLDRSLVVRTVAGLRPFRPAGFRVDAEWLDGRPLVHNYGHGGSGVTLAPGTAELAADLAAAMPHRRAAVLGGGAVGLCTARALQARGFQVVVYTAERTPATTSNVAGALWGVFSIVDPASATTAMGERLAIVARRSHAFFAALPVERYGVRRIALYLVGAHADLPWEMALTPELFPSRRLLADEHPFAAPDVLATTTLMLEPERLLAALEADIVAAGGRIVQRRFAARSELAAVPEPILVNCTGLGARTLFGDPSVVPIKGELALLAAQPGIDYAVISLDDDAYLLPRESMLVVGGTRVRDAVDADPRDEEIDRILERGRRLYR